MVKVQISGFQHAHNLNALYRLASERNRRALDQLGYQAFKGNLVDLQVARSNESFETIDDGVHAEDGLLGKRVVYLACLAAHILKHGRQPLGNVLVVAVAQRVDVGKQKLQSLVDSQLGARGVIAVACLQLLVQVKTTVGNVLAIRVLEYLGYITQTILVCVLDVAIGLQAQQYLDKRSHWRLGQGISGGDVDALDLFGQTVQHGLEQRLVAQHDGGLGAGFDAMVFAYPLTDIVSLRTLSHG